MLGPLRSGGDEPRHPGADRDLIGHTGLDAVDTSNPTWTFLADIG